MEIIMGLTLLVIGFLLIYFFVKRKQQILSFAYIDDYTFHKGVISRFKKVQSELSVDEVNTVVLGLKDYFKIHQQAGGRILSMPSQVVDDLWHEFILFTKQYETFCKGAAGFYVHHIPAEAMEDKITASKGIKNTWKYACELENLNPKDPTKLPRLFTLDERYKIPNGFYYTRNCKGHDGAAYCASHIGCSGNSGCGTGSDASSDTGSSCSSGCGGGD